MRTVNLPIVFHFHQPVDNFDHVIENIYQKSYLPLLERIKRSNVKFTLHFTGSIIDWMEARHPGYLDDVRDLCLKGQVEIIGGGYYEPILAVLPDDDKQGQIRLLNETILRRFSTKPRGFWLAERVWEPNLPKFLAREGLDYIIVDDNHLKSCGFEEKDTYHYYATEDSGYTIFVFPINERARYLAPWKPVRELKDYLLEVADEKGDRIILFMSDAEKMGEWGTTHELCYVKGHDGEAPYIDELFNLIENNEWIHTVTLSECLERFKPGGLVYLPTASYDKMEEWVLPTPSRLKMEKIREALDKNEIPVDPSLELARFVKGGFWRYFLAKYPEANNMHKKMLRVHEKIAAARKVLGEMDILKEATRELYKSQANDCYWHGQFGGIYLNFLRHSVYRHAIMAENLVQEAYEKRFGSKGDAIAPRLEKTSFLKNGRDQVVCETSLLNLYIDPDDGGTIFELDFRPKAYNLMNTLARWKEAYHVGGNTSKLAFDDGRKVALRDRIVPATTNMETYRMNGMPDLAAGFSSLDPVLARNKDEETGTTVLSVEIENRGQVGESPVVIRKKVTLADGEARCSFEISTDGRLDEAGDGHVHVIDFPLYFNGDPARFSVEVNGGDLRGNPLDGMEVEGTRKIMLVDGSYNIGVTFTFSSPVRAWIYNHETFSRMNTDDYQSKYQGIGMAFVPGSSQLSFDMVVHDLDQ